MELDSFSIFLTTAEEMNFTRAAEKLYMSQQSLSAHIKRLERIYGVELFQRKPVLKLTPAGETMIFFAKQMLESEEAMTNRFADISGDCMGVLRLGMSYQRSEAFFSDIWQLYHSGHENISLRLHERMTTALLDELQTGSIDLMTGLDIPEVPNLEIVPLAQEQVRCAISEQLLQKYFPDTYQEMLERYAKEGVDLIELKSLPILVLPRNNRLRGCVETIFHQNHIMPPLALETTSHSLILQLAVAGNGIGIMNPLAIFQYLRSGKELPENCHIFHVRGTPKYTVSVAYRREDNPPEYLLSMVDCIKEEYSYYVELLKKYNI